MKYLVTALFALLLSACSSQFQTVTQVDDVAHLQLSGDFSGATLTINEQAPINLDSAETFTFKNEKVAKFQLATGSHNVKVERGGKLLVNRKIYVSNGNTFELRVP